MASHEQHTDLLVKQPSERKCECRIGASVEPLHVVDGEQDPAGRCERSEHSA
jgi:hypothetical protein